MSPNEKSASEKKADQSPDESALEPFHIHGPGCNHGHHHHHHAHDPYMRSSPKIGRNDPCHCGSGKKFKKCCGGAAS